MRVLDHQLDQRLAAEPLGHCPGGGLVEPHERRLDRHRLVEAEADRDLQRLEGVVAAVGVAGVVGFAHAADEHQAGRRPGRGATAKNSTSRPRTKVSRRRRRSRFHLLALAAEGAVPQSGQQHAGRRRAPAPPGAASTPADQLLQQLPRALCSAAFQLQLPEVASWAVVEADGPRRGRSARARARGRRSSPGRRRRGPGRRAGSASHEAPPWPSTTHFCDVRPSRPTGPRACSLSVEMPISVSRPYSKLSAKRVETLTITLAEPTSRRKRVAAACESVTMASVWCEPWRPMWRIASSSELTTLMLMIAARYSSPQSASVASHQAGAGHAAQQRLQRRRRRRASRCPWSRTPRRSPAGTAPPPPNARPAVLGGIARAELLRLGVVDDSQRHGQVGGRHRRRHGSCRRGASAPAPSPRGRCARSGPCRRAG